MSDAGPSALTIAPKNIGGILLAAGASRRLGTPKQLLRYEGRPLITRAAETILAAGISPVVVVLGAHAEQIRPALAGLPVVIIENADWAAGMGASIRCGIAALEDASPTLDGALIALCDQPHFSRAAIDALRRALTGSITIAATRHLENAGVPAIFLRRYFPMLRALVGSEGARRIISAHLVETAPIDLPELAVDIDTAADWEKLDSI